MLIEYIDVTLYTCIALLSRDSSHVRGSCESKAEYNLVIRVELVAILVSNVDYTVHLDCTGV